MKLLNTVFAICIIILIMMFLTSCTVKFKAQEMEFEAEQTRVYKFDGLDLFGIPLFSLHDEPEFIYASGLPKVYACQ